MIQLRSLHVLTLASLAFSGCALLTGVGDLSFERDGEGMGGDANDGLGGDGAGAGAGESGGTGGTDAGPCEPGEFLDGSTCEACPPDTFSTTGSATSCQSFRACDDVVEEGTSTSDRQCAWEARVGSSAGDSTRDVWIRSDDSVYVVGQVVDQTFSTDGSDGEVFVTSFGPDGDHLWTTQFDVPNSADAGQLRAFAFGVSDGVIVAAQRVNGDVIRASVTYRKFDEDGELVWSKVKTTSNLQILSGLPAGLEGDPVLVLSTPDDGLAGEIEVLPIDADGEPGDPLVAESFSHDRATVVRGDGDDLWILGESTPIDRLLQVDLGTGHFSGKSITGQGESLDYQSLAHCGDYLYAVGTTSLDMPSNPTYDNDGLDCEGYGCGFATRLDLTGTDTSAVAFFAVSVTDYERFEEVDVSDDCSSIYFEEAGEGGSRILEFDGTLVSSTVVHTFHEADGSSSVYLDGFRVGDDRIVGGGGTSLSGLGGGDEFGGVDAFAFRYAR